MYLINRMMQKSLETTSINTKGCPVALPHPAEFIHNCIYIRSAIQNGVSTRLRIKCAVMITEHLSGKHYIVL